MTEASNEKGQEFGEELLVDSLRRHRQLPCESLVSALADDVKNFSPHKQHDDITVIVARVR